MSATIGLVGPSTLPGAPQITPEAINLAVNAALVANYAALLASVLTSLGAPAAIGNVTPGTAVFSKLAAGPANDMIVTTGDNGVVNYPIDGLIVGGSLSVGASNPSGFSSSAVGTSIVLGGVRTASGNMDKSSSANGVNGGFDGSGVDANGNPISGLQAMMNYGGVDAVGLSIGAGPYLPPGWGPAAKPGDPAASPTITGNSFVVATTPIPPAFRRKNTVVALHGLTSLLCGFLADGSVSADGFTGAVTGWGDMTTKAVNVNPASYALAAGSTGITLTAGYVQQIFGQNTVAVLYPYGPTSLTGYELDMSADIQPLNSSGFSVNNSGNFRTEYAFSCDGGSLGGAPGFDNGYRAASVTGNCFWAEMNRDGTPQNHAVVGLRIDCLYNIPIVVFNATMGAAQTPVGGEVFTVNSSGEVFAQGKIATNTSLHVFNTAGTNQTASIDGPSGIVTCAGVIASSIVGSGALTNTGIISTNSGLHVFNAAGTNQTASIDGPSGIVNCTGVIATTVALGQGGPQLTALAGVPTDVQPKGSVRTRPDGAVGSTLYVSQGGGTWNAVAGV